MKDEVVFNGKEECGGKELDITQVPEESIDASQASTEDLNQTLQEEMALRKNLDIAFADTQEDLSGDGPQAKMISQSSTASIQQRIAQFERKVAENQKRAAKPPPVPSKPDESGKERHPKQLKVFLRVRPCTESESVMEVVPPINKTDNAHPTKLRTYPSAESTESSKHSSRAKEYEFTQVFSDKSTQSQIYDRTAAPLVNKLCSGNRVGDSALLFSYGITNAGKTYTVLGDIRKRQKPESHGIVPRCLTQLLQKVSNTDLNVYMSYFEIYNENVFDLLPSVPKTKFTFHVGAKPLKIRERNGQTVIKGLTKHHITSLEQGMDVVCRAKEHRHTASNSLNRNSSRSHSVCQITVSKGKMEPVPSGDDESSVDTASLIQSRPDDSATLWIVDLAGSERSKRTNGGTIRQKEASFINKSLMTLMGCLTRGEKNYRDSKLTVLFMHHWMKRGATSMIVNVHPSRQDFDETQHVLAYAISTKAIPNPIRRSDKSVPAQATTHVVEYGYDGRRKNVRSTKNNYSQHNSKMMGDKMAGTKQGLESGNEQETKKSRPKRPSTVSDEPFHQAKRQKVIESTANSTSEMDKELLFARAQIESLQARNRELDRKLETMETTIRDEVAEEMLEEMTAMTKRYDDTIRDLKAKHAAHTGDDATREKLDRALQKNSELEEQITECEEEMSRMAETHAFEQRTIANEVAEKDCEIERLRSLFEESEAETRQLKQSKEELIRNYEKLLADGGDEDEDASPGSKAIPKTSTLFSTEPRQRRRLGLKTSATTPSTNRVADKLSKTQPKPWRMVESKGENISNEGASMSENLKESNIANHEEKPKSRQPLGTRSVNVQPSDENKFMYPTKPAKKDPSTGSFLRPRGRAPSGVAEWNETVGAWSLMQQ